MAGYSDDYSMSNNAIAAYDAGLVPASKIKGIPPALIRKFCRADEWHHSSKAYNRVDFFNPPMVRATFGMESCEDYPADPEAVAALAAHNAAKPSAVAHTGCLVRWIEWSGTLKRPTATHCEAEGCAVVVKGQTATVTLPDGRTLTKRLSTSGFEFIPSRR